MAAAVLHDFDFSLELLDLLLRELLVVQHLDRHGIASASALHHDNDKYQFTFTYLFVYLFTYLFVSYLLSSTFLFILICANGKRAKKRALGGVVAGTL